MFGSEIYWAEPGSQYSEDYPFTDQPEFDESDQEAEELDRETFERIWAEGKKQ
ncbi:MAG TPA: hypothetical protein VK206_10150 [Anaerolineales bacterium]|uniref:Uncharacterized protein n=1 Tax=Massilia cellulosiltytica TaxID=2683234 RepID=A0A7X3G491_9BURK|nr:MULTISPECIES: hypothetical protein [Telluria group]MVW62382.1 hypothetical protein [Telluria cellulosilytica]HLO15180.1 hypothetical protein [Anaerolineales bacterium]